MKTSYVNVIVEIKHTVTLQYTTQEAYQAAHVEEAIARLKNDDALFSDFSATLTVTTPFIPSDY